MQTSSQPTGPTLASFPEKINVLLIGGGGREHAIAWKLKQSKRLGVLYTTNPENPGIAALAKAVDVPVSIREIYRLQQFCDQKQIHLVVIGPEEPLAEGFTDKLAAPMGTAPSAGNPAGGVPRVVFGPTKQAAQLEADKAACKQLLRAASIPTGEARIFTDYHAALTYLETRVAERQHIAAAVAGAEMVREFDKRVGGIIGAIEEIVPKLSASDRVGATIGLVVAAGEQYRDPADRRKLIEELRRTNKLVAAAYDAPHRDLPVIKAAGLAKGKGVILPESLSEAAKALHEIMVRKVFGAAGNTVVIEERLEGREVSVLAIVDGHNILVLPPCQDHKRLKDLDKGPNTGGMGAYCPSDALDEALMAKVEREILVPTVDALRRDGIEYRGVLYAGLMLTPGGPKVLEYNCRFGDPECQPLMMRLKSDLVELMLATAVGKLDEIEVEWDERPACCVVMASPGYPEKPRTGGVIKGLEENGQLRDAAAHGEAVVFHAGTKRSSDGELVTNGGRVLGVTALGASMKAAREAAYAAVKRIGFEGAQVRTDIGA